MFRIEWEIRVMMSRFKSDFFIGWEVISKTSTALCLLERLLRRDWMGKMLGPQQAHGSDVAMSCSTAYESGWVLWFGVACPCRLTCWSLLPCFTSSSGTRRFEFKWAFNARFFHSIPEPYKGDISILLVFGELLKSNSLILKCNTQYTFWCKRLSL